MAYTLSNTDDFLTALQAGHIVENEEIFISRTFNVTAAIQALATALQSGQCPQGLQINFWDNNVGHAGAQALATALQSGRCPQELKIYLWDSNIGTVVAQALAIALQSGQCPQGLLISLHNNNIGDTGVQALATALQSGQCPQGLQIGLGSNKIDGAGVHALATALQSGQCPQGLQIGLECNNIGDAGVHALATALQSGQCPQGLQIKLRSNKIGATGAQALATALQSRQCPQGLQIDLGANNIGVVSAQALATALQSGQCPLGLQIDLRDNTIGPVGVQALATALQSGQCPQGLKIDLDNSYIGAAGVQALATALQSGKCPHGLQIHLLRNDIGDADAQALVTALQSGQCPQGLKINLAFNEIGAAGAQALASALQSGKCPQGLQINLERNKIGDAGAQALATALQSGQCPQGLQINLALNDIGAAGAQAMATALQSGQWPQELQINLGWSDIGDAGAQALTQAILSGNCPLGLCLDEVYILDIHLQTAFTALLHAGQNSPGAGTSSSQGEDNQDWPAILNAFRGVLCFNPDIILANHELKQAIRTCANRYIHSFATQGEGAIKENYLPIAHFLLAMCEVPYVKQGSSNMDNLITHLKSVLNNCLTPQASKEAASSSDNPPNAIQDWPHVLSLIHSMIHLNVHLIFADEPLRQTIQEALEYYIRQLQNHADDVSKDDYGESYFPAFNEVATVILVMYETSQTAPDIQKRWVSTLMLTLEGSLIPQQPLDWPAELSLWARAQRLILIEKAFSLYPDNPNGLARHWQDFCDEFNAVPLGQRRFEQRCEVNQIKKKAENAMAIDYYYQTCAKGLCVLPNLALLGLSPQKDSTESRTHSSGSSSKAAAFTPATVRSILLLACAEFEKPSYAESKRSCGCSSKTFTFKAPPQVERQGFFSGWFRDERANDLKRLAKLRARISTQTNTLEILNVLRSSFMNGAWSDANLLNPILYTELRSSPILFPEYADDVGTLNPYPLLANQKNGIALIDALRAKANDVAIAASFKQPAFKKPAQPKLG